MAIETRLKIQAIGIECPGGDADLIESIAIGFDQIENGPGGCRQFFFRANYAPYGELGVIVRHR